MPKNAIQLMYKISELASLDIDSIIDYTFLNFGVDTMIEYHSSLETCFETLADNPYIGLESNFIRNDFLRFNHRSHVIFYQIIESDILIIRVLHKSMDVARQFV